MQRRSKDDPRPINDPLEAYLLDDRPARLVCPDCKCEREGKVFRSWWILAERKAEAARREGKEPVDPFWEIRCQGCENMADMKEEARKRDAEPKVSEDLSVQFPTVED